jgi:formylmethanofuran dehydrogenase subunit C
MNIVEKIEKLVDEKLSEINTFDIGKITDANNSKLLYNVKLKHKIEGNEIELFRVPLAPARYSAGSILCSLNIGDIVGVAFSKYELKQQLKNKDILDVNEVLKFDLNNAIIVSGIFTDVDSVPVEFEDGTILIKHKSGNYIKFEPVNGNIEIKGNTDVTGTLNVSGNVTIKGAFEVTGNANINGDMSVNGNLTFTSIAGTPANLGNWHKHES